MAAADADARRLASSCRNSRTPSGWGQTRTGGGPRSAPRPPPAPQSGQSGTVCKNYNAGTCTRSPCPNGFAHRCAICNKSGHPAWDCYSASPAQKDQYPHKGKSKGKGKQRKASSQKAAGEDPVLHRAASPPHEPSGPPLIVTPPVGHASADQDFPSTAESGLPPIPAASGVRRKPTCLHPFSWPQRRPDGIAAIIRKVGWAARDVDIVNVGPDGDKSAHDLSSDLLWESLFTDLRKGSYDAVSWALLARRPRRQGTSLRARHRFGHQIFRTGFRIAALSASVRAGSPGHLFCFTVCQTPSRGVHPRRRLRHETPEPRPGIVSIFTLPEFLALSDSEW